MKAFLLGSLVVALLLASLAEAQTNLTPTWSVGVSGWKVRHGAAVGVDGTIYVTADGSFDAGHDIYTSPALLHALRPDGSLKWTFTGADGAASAPTVGPDGAIYYGARQAPDGYARFHAVNPDGTQRWRKEWYEVVIGNAAVSQDGRVLAISHLGNLWRFEADGTANALTWTDVIGSEKDDWATPVVAADGTVYFGERTTVLQALTPAGESKWSFRPNSTLTGLAIAPEGTVYVCAGGGLMCALNPDGSERWRIARSSDLRCAPAVGADGTIYLPAAVLGGPSETGELLRLGRAGELLGTNTFAGAINKTPALAADGTIWVTDASGKLSVVGADGQLVGEYGAAGLGAAPVITPDGLVIVTTAGRAAIAFQGAFAATNGWPMLGRDAQRSHHDTTAVPPIAPLAVEATTNQLDGIRVTWSEALETQATYEVWRSATANLAEAVRIARFLGPSLSHTDTNAAAGLPYRYWVRGQNGVGTGAFQGPATGLRLTPAAGGEMWHYSLPGFAWLGLAISPEGAIYLSGNNVNGSFPGTDNSRVVALSPTGEERWAVALGGLLAGPPVLGARGEVYVVARDWVSGRGLLLALGSGGTNLWQISDSSIFRPPVIGTGGELYAVTEQYGEGLPSGTGRNQYVFNPDGITLWSSTNNWTAPSPQGAAPPLLTGDLQLWLGGSTGLELFRPAAAQVWYNTAVGAYPTGMAPAPGGGIYAVSSKGLYALGSDGSVRWSILGTNFGSGPVLNPGGSLYVGTWTNAVLALTAGGAQEWVTPADGAVTATPVVGQDGGLFFGTLSGTLHAVNADGLPRWQFQADAPIRTAPALTPQGHVIFGTDGGMVWGLRADTALAASPWPKYQRNLANQGHAEGVVGTPGTPSNLVADVQSPGGTVVHLSWTNAAEAWGYEVWRAVGGDFAQAQPMATNLTVSLRFDDDLTRAGIEYGYWVRGVNATGAGPFVGPVLARQTNLLWGVPTGYATFTPVVAADGTVFVASHADASGNYRSELAAYDREGNRRWALDTGESITGAPTLGATGQLVYPIGALDGALRAVTPDGQIAWTIPVAKGPVSDPAVDAYGTTYVVGPTVGAIPYLSAVSVDGVRLWQKACGSALDHAVITPEGTICVAGGTTLYGFDPGGSIRWQQKSGTRTWGTPALNGAGELLAALNVVASCNLVRLTADGLPLATNQVPLVRWTPDREPVVAADGSVYYIYDRLLVAFDGTGTLRWTNRLQTVSTYGLPNVPALDAAGHVYVAGLKELITVDSSGVEKQRLELGRSPTAPPVLTPDGLLYVALHNRLYAIRALAGLDPQAPWPMYRHDPAGTASRHQGVPPPAEPVLLTPVPYANQVRIGCQSGAVAAALELLRNSTPDFATATLVAAGRAGQPFTDDTPPTNGVTYYYWARFRNTGGTSEAVGPVEMAAVEVPVRWFAEIPGALTNPPAVGPDGTIYTCTGSRLVALNSDGSTKWQIDGVSGAPAVTPDGAVVLRSGDRVHSLSATGGTNWVLEGITTLRVVPALGADGRAFVPGVGEELVAVSNPGSPLWRVNLGYYIGNSPSVAADGSVVLLASNSQLLRLNPDGTTNLTATLPDSYSMTSAPVLDAEGTVYLPTGSSRALVATRADGSPKWRLASTESVLTLPIVGVDGTVFAGYSISNAAYTVGGPEPRYLKQIAAVRGDGSVRWSFTTVAAPSSSVLGANGLLLVAAGSNLFALSADEGKLRWQLDSPNGQAFGPPILDLDGTLYAPVVGGILALKLDAGPAPSAWPMHRQNPRQSACIQRLTAPQLRMLRTPTGQPELELLAPNGGVILQSPDLQSWQRLGHQPPISGPAVWSLPSSQPCGFYRVVSP